MSSVKKTWKILNSVINKEFNTQTYPEYFMKNNKSISDKDIANGLNHFFTNVGPNLATTISLPEKDVYIYDYFGKGLESSVSKSS